MKAILVNPPSPRTSPFVHLGLAYLGTILADNEWETQIIDGSAPYGNHSFDSIVETINKNKPEFVGITVTTLFSTYAVDLITSIKEKVKAPTKIICGGPHATLMPDEMINAGADIAARGEGESTLEDLIDYFKGTVSIQDIPGISYRKENGTVCHNPDRDFIENLDILPFPNKDLFNLKDFIQTDREKYRISNIIASRGCPFSCTYCSKAVFGAKYRTRSRQSIIDEIDQLNSIYGIRHIDFIDDNFSLNKKKVVLLCEALRDALTFPLTWSCVTRVDVVDEDLLSVMKQAGCVKINYGIESVNNETLKKINKGFTSSKAKNVVLLTKKVGIPCSLNFMWGFPWETYEDVVENRLFMQELSKYAENINPAGTVIPFPGTSIYDEYNKKYQFANWWLHRRKFTGRYRDKICYPIFRFFGFEDQGMLEGNGFFNYSPKIKKEIRKVALFITKHNLRIHTYIQRKIAWIFILVSRRLYVLNPSIEGILSKIFYFLIKIKSGSKIARTQ